MPVSHHRHIAPILNRIDLVWNTRKFNSILDIGVGFGKYGVLLRERYDVRFKRCVREDWKIKIDGIEVYENYITPYHRYIYNEIIVGDILNLVDKLENYDIILMLEILEHLKKEDGAKILQLIKNKSIKLLLTSFPRTFSGKEGYDWPNIHERHLCLWTKSELDDVIGTTEQLTPTIFAKEFTDG